MNFVNWELLVVLVCRHLTILVDRVYKCNSNIMLESDDWMANELLTDRPAWYPAWPCDIWQVRQSSLRDGGRGGRGRVSLVILAGRLGPTNATHTHILAVQYSVPRITPDIFIMPRLPYTVPLVCQLLHTGYSVRETLDAGPILPCEAITAFVLSVNVWNYNPHRQAFSPQGWMLDGRYLCVREIKISKRTKGVVKEWWEWMLVTSHWIKSVASVTIIDYYVH